MTEKHPTKIRVKSDECDEEWHDGKWYDDEHYTHHPNDTLYIRADMIFDHLLSKGYNITVTVGANEEDIT